MRISPQLNLVVPVEQDDGTVAYVHSTPLSREVFERYFIVISKTFAALYASGLGPIAGPRVAAMMLKKIATDAGEWDGPGGVEAGLVAEVRRLSNVVTPKGIIPMQEAVDQKFFSPRDQSEVENAVAFFIVASSMHRRSVLEATLEGLAALWGGSTTSLNSTEFAASLPTLTPAAPTGATVAASSVPH